MKISVAITSYNYETYIEEAVGSIYQQTRQPDEVIVIDDGSTDQSREILERLKEKYGFTYLKQQNQGVTWARNKLIDTMTSDYNIFLDADDTIPPEYIATLENVARAHPSNSIFYTGAKDLETGKLLINPPEYSLEKLCYGNYIHTSCMVMTGLLKQEKYDTTLTGIGYEDFELILRLCMKGAIARLVPGIYLNYRQHDGVGRDVSVRDDFKSVQALEYIYFKMLGINPVAMEDLRWIHGRLKVATDYVARLQEETSLRHTPRRVGAAMKRIIKRK